MYESPGHKKQDPNENAMEGNQNSHRRIQRGAREAHKICKNKTKEYEEEKLQSVQTYNISNESRKFHQEVRRFKERYQPRSTI